MAVTITHTTPADGTFSATGAAAWDAVHNVTGAACIGANSDITSLTGLTTPLSVGQGGSGTATPSLVAGTNVTITGSWPNQTINATASGSVTSVTASSPIASSGGATPNISLTGIVTGTNGGTGVNNGSKTVTLGGNFTTSGAFDTTFTTTADTSITLPTSGYAISSVTNMAANPVTGTPSTTNFLRGDGTWAAVPAASLTIGSTTTSGGAAGRIMFDTGSVLQEGGNLVWNNTNGGLTLSSIANPTTSSLTINGASGYTGTTLSGVSITGTAGQFSCNSTTLTVGELVTISGTLGGTGTITGYANPTTYRISATNGTTTFTLINNTTGAAIVTAAGTPTGLTYTVTDPFINLSQTWNNSAVAFTGLRYNVTDTASNASSLLMDLQVGGVSKSSFRKDGALILTGASSTYGAIISNTQFRPGSILIGFTAFNGAAFGDGTGANAYASADSRGLAVSSSLSIGITSSTITSTIDTVLTRRGAS